MLTENRYIVDVLCSTGPNAYTAAAEATAASLCLLWHSNSVSLVPSVLCRCQCKELDAANASRPHASAMTWAPTSYVCHL